MQAQELIPDLLTYNTLLNGLCINKQIAEAFSFLHIMEEKGVNPDIITYGILIDGLCKDGKLEIARNLFNGLCSKGLQPDVHIYTTIIGSLCEEGLTEEAKCLLKEMETSGCAPNSVAYEAIIKGYLKGTSFMRQRHSWMKCVDEDFASSMIEAIHSGLSSHSAFNVDELVTTTHLITP
ncbi:UNVERIFIED_CONTAM: hypothetical protein Sradi_1593800 [Sesamum radiatum]|uniref:Pentatricopeptide repeat-containing protein n=1 Tax=Sesamum radiatum TaxID=300843 RepID=A0AAW2UE94_SESRA